MAEDMHATGPVGPEDRTSGPGSTAPVDVEEKTERKSATGGHPPRPESQPPRNGPPGSPATAPGSQADSSSMERAEEMVDRLAERLAHFTSVWGRKLLWLGARAREEAEDIWAEAQSLRRGQKP